VNETIKHIRQSHINALRAHTREGGRWGGEAVGPLSDAERQCVCARLIELDGWCSRTTPAGLSLLAALEAAKAGEIS